MVGLQEMMCFLLFDELCDVTVIVMMGDSNSDDGVLALVAYKQREKRVRVENNAEVVVPQYNFDTFRSHFRMSRQVLEFLEGLLAVVPGLPHEPKQGGKPPTLYTSCMSMLQLEIPLVQLINFGSIVNGTA